MFEGPVRCVRGRSANRLNKAVHRMLVRDSDSIQMHVPIGREHWRCLDGQCWERDGSGREERVHSRDVRSG